MNKTIRPARPRVGAAMLPIALSAAVLLFPGCHGSGAPAEEASGVQDQGNEVAELSTSTERPYPAEALVETKASAPQEQPSPPDLTLPDDFPAAVPLLPGRRIRSFSPRENGSFSLTCSVPGKRRETADFYRESLAVLGWEVTLDSRSGGMTTLSARQENGSRLTVNIIENPDEQLTMIGIYHRPPQELAGG